MKKKSFSLQKLPEISKQKKEKLNEKNIIFEQKLKGIQRLELHNELMSLKLKPYETARSFKRQFEIKTQEKANKIVKILSKHEKFVQLEPIRQVEYQSSKKMSTNTILFKTPSKKMDVDGYIKEKNDRLIEEELKQVQAQNSRRQYLPSVVQTEKQTLPYYSESNKKYQDQPFIKLQEKEDKLKIRFLNGFEKWVKKSSLKQIRQYQPLTLESYRKTIKNVTSNQIALLDLPENKEIVQKINIDSAFLNKMLNQIYHRKNPRQEIKKLLKQELYYNYEESVKEFNKMFVQRRQVKRINRFQRKNKVSDQIKTFIDRNLVCSYDLEFLDEYMLSKTHYISIMVESYNIIREIEEFQHFNKLYVINIASLFVEESVLSSEMVKYFGQQKDKIENIIYSLEEHLNVIIKVLYKDIEHIIFLNPRLVGSNYQKEVKTFIGSFSQHLSRIIRSILINSINSQLQNLSKFYKEYSVVKKHPLQCLEAETSEFYLDISGLNQPFYNKTINQRIIHGPGVIPITFTLKKWKRKKYSNIYKFIIQSRKNIRSFNQSEWRSFKTEEQRISFKDPLQLLESIVLKPLTQYLKTMDQSQNVNGCIYNKKIDLFDFINLERFKNEMTKIYTYQKEEKVKMYAAYFQLWELYFMEKPYIDDFIQLYKSIKAIKLIEQEMNFLKQDLKLIRSIPKIIELHFIRLDVTEIKEKIETTILSFMKKILKTCEETLGQMLEYGYQQTIKAKKLNEVTPYSNLAQYIDFINFLSLREVEKSIQKIAQNVIFIDLNMNLLQRYHYQVKFSLMQRYLESGTWIKKIRAAATLNKQKTTVDPFVFLKGVKDKRTKIFVKYNKILKEIIEMMKVSQLKNAMKLSILAKNIAHQMKEICMAADEIVKEQTLLELEYAPQDPQNIDEDRFYRTDLTFFYKQEKFLKKYLQFWTYTAKLRAVIDNIYQRKVINLDGVEFIRLLREGQQLISNIKISTLNKRFLHLCDEVMHQIQPFLKCSKLFLFLTIGHENYRVKVIKELTTQSSSSEMNTADPYNLSIREMISWPLMNLDWHGVYKIKEDEENQEFCRSKLNSIYMIIKNLEINIKSLCGVGNMKQFEIIVVDDEAIKILKKCVQTLTIIEKKHGHLFKNKQNEEDLMAEASKKLNIFYRSITKLKTVSQKMTKYYSIFEVVYPLIYPAFQDLNLSSYYVAYENVIVDMSKKADLAKKLTFITFYEDKVRISYDQDLKKLQQFQVRFYNEMIGRFYNNAYYGQSSLEKDLIFSVLSSFFTQDFNKNACRLMGDWCANVKFQLQYGSDYQIVLKEFQTIHKQKVKYSRRQKLFSVKKSIQNQAEATEIKCGLLIIIEDINKELENKVEQQTLKIFKIVYEYHYSIKGIFQLYLYINNLLLQSVINALMISFHLDLSLLYENKYDLNLLLTTIQQNKSYAPKQKDNFFIIQALIKIEEEFIALINVLQERQYCLDDVEKGRIKKAYAYNSIPRIILDNFDFQENKIWLDELKQEKEDDFINNLHLSPSLNRLNFLTLDLSKVETKEIEKKQQITNFQEELNINHMIITSHANKHGNRLRLERQRIKIVSNIAPQLHFQDVVIPFKFKIINSCPNSSYIFQSYRATQLLIEALHFHKILITNVHPNYQVLGRNFLKTSNLIPQYTKNMSIVVYSPKKLLSCIKAIISSQRHKSNKFIYIYYDKLSHEEIQTELVDDHCIVYEARNKMHLNCLLKKQLNFNERQIIKNLINTQSHFLLCHPFAQSYEKILPSSLLRFGIDGKQKEILTGLIYSYQNSHGLSSEITEQKILMISQPIYAITDSHFLLNYYFDLGQYIYTKILKIASVDFNRQIMNDLVNTLIPVQQHSLAAYILPIYDFTREELFNTVKYQSFDQKIQDKYDKEIFTIKINQRPYFQKGILHELIAFLSDKGILSQKWNQFRLKGFEDATVKWFIIDISEETDICNQVFQFFIQSLSNNEYVFDNGSFYSTHFHYNQRLIKDHKHKLIFILHPNQLNQYKNDFPPLPIINQTLRFDPMKDFKIFVASLSQSFSQGFLDLVRIPDLISYFKQILTTIGIETVTIESMETLKNIYYIMMNEVRKRQIALGHYSQSSLTVEQSKQNLYGSIDLRERTKLQQEMLVELQQIQKRMDLTRREIYKVHTQNIKYDQPLTQSTQQRLQYQFNILNPTSYNKQEINQILKSSLVFAVFYSLTLSSPKKIIELSKMLEPLTHRTELHNYCFSIQSNRWQRWQEIDTNLNFQSCSSSTLDRILNPKEILRHNLSKNKLVTLRDYSKDIDLLHNKQPQLLQMKGPQIFFTKLFILYNFPFRLTLPKTSYPTWMYQHDLSLFDNRIEYLNEPLRNISESKSKKLAKFLGGLKLKDFVIKKVEIEGNKSLLQWKSAIKFQIMKKGFQWYQLHNTSVYFISSEDQDVDRSSKIKLVKSHIIVECQQQETNHYKLLTMIFNTSRFQMLQSNLQNVLLSFKAYQNRLEFFENYKFRQYFSKGLSNQQVQEIFGLKLIVTQPEKYSQTRRKIKEIINKIKLQSNENQEELLPDQLQKIKDFDRIFEINQMMARIISCVEIKRSQISKNFLVRYLLKKPRKYERIESPQVSITKRRMKSPVKVEFDDILFFDQSYDRSNIILEEHCQNVLFFNLNQRLLLVQNIGSFNQKTIDKYITSYKVYKKAVQTMLNNKTTKPFTVDIKQIENFEVNCKVIELYNINSLQLIRQQFKSEAKEKISILVVYNTYIISQLIQMMTNNEMKSILQPKNHFYILFAPKLNLTYNHGLRTILEDSQDHSNYLFLLRQQKINKLILKLQQFTKVRVLSELQQSNIGQNYIPSALQKINDIKNYTSSIKNELLTKKDVVDRAMNDIESATKNLNQCKIIIQENQKKIKEMEVSLNFWKLKRQYYIGNEQFKEMNRQIKEIQRKRLERQLNRPQYIQDNSYNISYIYTFNILADNNYFPDKTLYLLDQEYELNKNYQIPQDQKKLFQKHFNYGRLSAIIDNDELVFGQGLIQQDHLIMASKVRSKFVYLRHVNQHILQEKIYDKQTPFSLNWILKQELSHIHRHKGNECEEIFNRYVAFLFTHKYIKFLIEKTIETTEQQLKKARQSILKTREKIEHQQLKFSSNTTFLQQIKSKYEINQRQLQTCKKNQDIFIKQTNQNVLQIANLLFRHLLGMNIQYKFQLANKMINEEIRKQQGIKENGKKIMIEEQDINHGYLKQAIVKEIKDKQVIASLAEYVIDQMIKPKRRLLNQKEKQFIIGILARQTLDSFILKNNIQTIEDLYEQIIIYLVSQLFPDEHEVYQQGQTGQIQKKLDYRKYNIISLAKSFKSETHQFCKEIQNNYRFQVKGLINRIQHKKNILNNALLRFSEKIGLIQAKSTQSIMRFLLQSETIMNIEEYLVNCYKAITSTPNENMYYDGEWLTKNQDKLAIYQGIIIKIKQKLEIIYEQAYNQQTLLYYVKLIGMIGKKISLSNLDSIIEQLYYDHSIEKREYPKQIKQSVIQRRFQVNQSEQNLTELSSSNRNSSSFSYISTLDSLLLTPMNLILVHGSSILSKVLFVKALRSNKVLKRKEELLYYNEENRGKEYWILVNINHDLKVEQLILKIRILQQNLNLAEENHMKFVLLFESNSWSNHQLKLIQSSVQPIYRFYYRNSPMSIYYHMSYIFQQFSQRTINTQLATIFSIAKHYYHQAFHIPIFHIQLSGLQMPQLMDLLEILFDQFDFPAQSLYYKIVASLCKEFQSISKEASQKLGRFEKENFPEYIDLWEDEQKFNQIISQSSIIEQRSKDPSLLCKWANKIQNSMAIQSNKKESKLKNISFSQLMKPKRDEMGFLTNEIQSTLSNPYKFIAINRCLSKMIEKIIIKRHKANNPLYRLVREAQKNQQTNKQTHQLIQITNKKQLFLQILHGANTSGLRLNNISIQISQKDFSGSIGIHFNIIGVVDDWLKNLFGGELFMSVTDKKHKNANQLNYIKGVYFRYSEPIIYVKKQVQFGEEDTNIMRPLPQYKNLLSIYTPNNQYIGIIELTTNQQLTNTPSLIIKLKS